LTKGQWGDQHTTVGVLFLIAGFLHIYYNWRPIVAYMKNKAKEVKVFTGSFNIALIVSVVFVVGTYYNIPPLSTILELSTSIKDSAAREYGEPPYGHAELSSLKFLVKKEYLDLEKTLEVLKAAGIKVSGEKETLLDIADSNNMTPQQVYEVIKTAKPEPQEAADGEAGAGSFPDAPTPGWAKKSFEEFCELYGLKVNRIVQKLDEKGIKVDATATIKENADANEISPITIFEEIQEIVTGSAQ